jgi:hypothetical protein
MYRFGIGFARDARSADVELTDFVKWGFNALATDGEIDDESAYKLAVLAYRGEGVVRDTDAALSFLAKCELQCGKVLEKEIRDFSGGNSANTIELKQKAADQFVSKLRAVYEGRYSVVPVNPQVMSQTGWLDLRVDDGGAIRISASYSSTMLRSGKTSSSSINSRTVQLEPRVKSSVLQLYSVPSDLLGNGEVARLYLVGPGEVWLQVMNTDGQWGTLNFKK